ncbi:hypothetical protein EF405_20230 [Cyclobacteriaceae bacterium YHN15]|nr:hypothetical protein EF405_20230 [Cyclobacteriaceae bacterium YHN15]
MLIGEFLFHRSRKFENKFFDKNLITSNLIECFEHDFFSINFYLLFHKNLPYTKKDFIKVDSERKIIIIKYGNIYNHDLLKKQNCLSEELTELEVIDFLFFLKGENFIQELNGDFIIIIYEAEINKLYVFRDCVGVYPLVFSIKKDSLVFSTDFIFLCKELQEKSEINFEPLLSEFRFADLKQTVNSSVKKLLPGHFFKYEDSEISIKKYWEPEKIKVDKNLSYDQVMNDLRALVHDALHIRSDKQFKAAAHVSSGLDSGVVSALVRKEYKDQSEFFGYSWSPESFSNKNIEFDERELVKEVCQLNDISPVFVNFDSRDYEGLSKNYIRNFGYFAEEKILEHAKNNNVNLIFSGWGGDEFISKGERGINSDLLFTFKIREFFKRNPIKKPKQFLKVLLYDIFLPMINSTNPNQKKVHKEWARYLKSPYNRQHYPSVKKFLYYRSRRDLHLGFLYHYHIPERTEKWHVNGFLNGVEYRYPLLDYRIIEYLLKVPSELLIKGEFSRMVLREIGNGILPERVRWLRKGIDPIIASHFVKLNQDVSKSLINKLKIFRENKDLYFIDFDLLEKDTYECEISNKTDEGLYQNLTVIDLLHEFSKRYRGK